MDRRKRKLLGVGLLVLGAVTVYIAMYVTNRAQQEQMERNLAAEEAWGREHPGQSRGGEIFDPPVSALILLSLGGLFVVLGGALVVSGRLGRAKFETGPAPVGNTPPSAVPAVPVDCLTKLKRRADPIVASFPDEQLLRTTVDHLGNGHRIDAIKSIREATGCSLDEAKRLCDELQLSIARL